MNTHFQGLFTALVTPFTKDNTLDEEGLILLLEKQIEAKVAGIVLLGTTGESPLLSKEEKKAIVILGKSTLKKNNSSCQLISGGLFFSAEEAISSCLEMEEIGVDGHLLLPPPYLKPSQEAIFLYFKTIALALKKPVIIYDHPGRTGVSLSLLTLSKLAEEKNIAGIKACSSNLLEIYELILYVKQKNLSFSILSGDDALSYPLILMGASGVISVASNLFPKKIQLFITSLLKNELVFAKTEFEALYPLFKALFLEANPSPLKKALEILGLPGGLPRLPFLPVHTSTLETLQIILQKGAVTW